MAAWLMALAPVAGLTVHCLGLLACYRLVPRLGLLKAFLAGFAAGLLAALLLTLTGAVRQDLSIVETLGHLTANSLAYGALGYGLFHFINLGETARRIRILREFLDAGGTLDLDEVLRRYNAAMIVQHRIERLLRNRQIVMRDGRYFIGRRTVLHMARIITFMKLLVLGKSSEFADKASGSC